MEKTREHMMSVLASQNIAKNGLDHYYNAGVRFGFFDPDDEELSIHNVCQNIIDRLVDYEEFEEAEKLKNILINHKHDNQTSTQA
jgi:hypothetical protein